MNLQQAIQHSSEQQSVSRIYRPTQPYMIFELRKELLPVMESIEDCYMSNLGGWVERSIPEFWRKEEDWEVFNQITNNK